MDLGAPIGTHTSTGQTGSAPGNFTSTPIADKFSSTSPNARQYDTTNQTTGQALQEKATEILHGHSTTTQGQGYSTSGQGYNTTSGQDYNTTSGQGYNSSSGLGHSHNSTSDSYGSTGQSTTQGLKEKAENLLHGNKSGETTSHGHGHNHGESAVSGQYAGGSANALTGESHAQRTGAGVGPLGENLGGEGHHHHHHHDNTATGITSAGQGAQSSSDYRSSAPLTKETPETAAGYGTGVGAQGGAGGHYSREGQGQGHTGAALGAGAGLGAAGAYEAGHHHSSTQQGQGYSGQQSGDYNSSSNNNNDTTNGGIAGGKGHYGKASDGDFNRGAPLSKDLDSGNPHSLVYQESTGKYVHRRDL